MSDDLLSQMTSALAEEHDGATAAPEATRGRVIRALAERRPPRRKWWAVGIPAFVLLGGSTAWASATGHLPAFVEKAIATLRGVEHIDEQPPAPPSAFGNSASIDTKGLAPALEPIAEAPVKDEREVEAPAHEPASDGELIPSAPAKEAPAPRKLGVAARTEAETPPEEARPPRKPEVAARTEAGTPPEDHSALLSYRAAHRAHFQAGDCPGAVAGYRKYLREQPGGSFALEAKYNLAVCLIRLGHKSEAVDLLRPFAEGHHGNYRREKSQELIQRLAQH